MTNPEVDINVLCEAFKSVYGKPLPWHRFLFYSFAENEQWFKDQVKKYIAENES